MKQHFTCILVLALLLPGGAKAQMVGGNFSGQAAPKEVKAPEISKGAYTSDVNLFTGTMGTSYDLGSVSTPSGLHFNLQLSHSSAKTVGNNPLVVAGIPYGDGWNIHVPTISISAAAYYKYSDTEIKHSLSSTGYYAQEHADYSFREFTEEGKLSWYAPVITIPGVISERFIFKAFDHSLGEAIFVPNKMDSYVEARFKYGSYWKVTDHNGDVYSFTSYSASFRTAQQLNFTEDSMRMGPAHVTFVDSTSFYTSDSLNSIIQTLQMQNPKKAVRIANRTNLLSTRSVITYWIITSASVMKENLLPQEEINTWYCNYIYNKNAPLNQQISFHYSSYGSFDFYKEINQEYLNRQISSDYAINASGTIPAFKFHRDVLLESVSSYYLDRGMIEEIDLVHRTVIPDYSAGPKNMLLLTEPSVQRLDSMYNYRIVYSQGVNTESDSSILSSNAYRHTARGLSFNAGANVIDGGFGSWRRYLHVMSSNTIASSGRAAASGLHHPAFATTSNPFLFSTLNAGISRPSYKYTSATADLVFDDLQFDHGFLESPRIEEDIIPGDVYEVRSVIRNYNISDTLKSVEGCNFDLNIVSGYPLPVGNVTFPFQEIGDASDQTVEVTDYERGTRGVSIFSTFGNPLKWTSFANTNGSRVGLPPEMVGVINTSNFFLMPVIPKKFRGVNIQVGPANADIDYALDQTRALAYMNRPYAGGNYWHSAYFGFKKEQENDANGQTYPGEDFKNPHFKPARNFGIGMPWYMMNNTYAAMSGSPYNDQLNTNYRFWWKDGSFDYNVIPYANQPTMADNGVSLSAMELVRYSKNPYMLVAVKKYKFNGYSTNDSILKNKYLVSQLNLNYEVRVDSLFTNLYAYPNIPITQDTTVNCFFYDHPTHTSVPLVRHFTGKEFIGFQNVYLLSRITQIPVNGSLGNAPSAFTEAEMPSTHFGYQKLDADSLAQYVGKYDFTGNLYTLNRLTDQLGGTMEYDYYPLHDTKHTRWADLYRDYAVGTITLGGYDLPGPDVYKIQVAVKSKRYYTSGASALPAKTWRYDYSDELANGVCQLGIPTNLNGVAPPNTGAWAHYRTSDAQLDFGFKKTTVSYPQLITNGLTPCDVYTHYTDEHSRMAFGKLKSVAQNDAAGKTLNKKEYFYKKSMAYGNIMITDNLGGPLSGIDNRDGNEYYYAGSYAYVFSAGTIKAILDALGYYVEMNTNYERMPLLEATHYDAFKPLNGGHYSHCYFVRLVKETSTDYDFSMPPKLTLGAVHANLGGVKLADVDNTTAPAGTSALRLIKHKPVELFSGTGSIKHAISRATLNPGQLYTLLFSNAVSSVTDYEYWDADSLGISTSDGFRRLLNTADSSASNRLSLRFEPSWELFRKSMSSPQLVQAYKKSELYYYYDLKQDINPNNSDFLHPEEFDALSYSQRYGIRNLPYEKREIAKAVSHPEVSKSLYYWYDTRTKTDTAFVYDTLYVNGHGGCPPVVTHPPVIDAPTYQHSIGCYAIPHPFSPPATGFHFTQTGPNNWMYCPDVIDDSIGRPTFYPNDLHTKLLLRRVDEQVDTVRFDFSGQYYSALKLHPVMRFREFELKDPADSSSSYGYDYTWKHNFPFKTVYGAVAHTPTGFVREEVNERGLHTRYDYRPIYSTAFIDSASNCLNGGAWDMTNQGVPQCITVGYGETDALTTCYTYNPDFTVKSITDPNSTVLSYFYDPFSRLSMARRNSDTLSLNAYSQWMNDTSLTFEQRAEQNYVESYILLDKGSTVAEHSRAYVDPLGRKYDVQTQVTENYTNPTLYDTLMVHSGLTTFDNWDRVEKQYKPFKYVNGGSPVAFAPRFNGSSGPYTQQQYEPSQRSRVLRAAKFGESIVNGHTVNSSYQVISGNQLWRELGPYYFVFINEITGTTDSIQLGLQRYLKTAVMDEDGNKSVSYANAFGQKVASKNYPDAFSSLVTAYVYDSQGNLKKVTDPRLRSTTYEYNLCGNMFRKVNVDTDTVRYLYDASGNVVLEQDANGRHGVDEAGQVPYLRKYTYDKFNRLVLQERMHYNTAHHPMYYTPVPGYDSLIPYYIFSHGSSLDFVTGWQYYKCYYVYRPGVEVPGGSLDPPNWPPIQPPTGGGGKPCIYLFMNPYDSLRNGLPEKAWRYHTQATYFDTDLAGTPLQFNTNGRLTLSKSYTHAGAFSNLRTYSYNDAGLLLQETVEFVKPAGGRISSVIDYQSYNLRNSLTRQKVDADGDGTADMEYAYEYDGWNRLRKVKAYHGAGTPQPLATYDYDDALGLLTKSRAYFFDPRFSCFFLIDSTDYSYDTRNRLAEHGSKFYREKLFYDLYSPQTQQAAFGVHSTANFNGNINGIIHRYKLNAAANYAGTAGIMDSSTVYGYAYDKINRLVFADASVLNTLDHSAGYGVYGPRLVHGDESMVYDDLGNITDLKRGLYQGGMGSLSHNGIQDWHYTYGYNNRMGSVDSINSIHLRDYNYDMNGNMTYQTAGKSKSHTGYMRSNLPQQTTFRADTTDAGIVLNALYAYNASDDRVYKELEVDGQYKRSYYLRDAMGKELGEYELDDSTWTHYAYGRDRIAEYKDENTANYYVYDHLGSVRLVYGIQNCNTTPQYRIRSASDYYAFGKTLRSFNNSSPIGYQGSQQEKEFSTHDYYTHYRGLDVDVARWKGVDPVFNPGESPYVSMGNNPVIYNDILGNTTEDWFKNLRTGKIEWNDATGKVGDQVSLKGGKGAETDTYENVGNDHSEEAIRNVVFHNTLIELKTYPASGRIDQDYFFDGGAVAGVVVSNVLKLALGPAFKYAASKLASKATTNPYAAYGFQALTHIDDLKGVTGLYIFDDATRAMLPYVGKSNSSMATRLMAHNNAGRIGAQIYFKPLSGSTTFMEVQETIMMNNLGGKLGTANLKFPVSPLRNARLGLGITNY